MACEYCTGHEVIDHGFSLPDDRVVYRLPSPCDCCEGKGVVHCTLTGKVNRTLGRWNPDTGKHDERTWADYDVRAVREGEAPSAPGYWTDTVEGIHGVLRLTDTTFLEECSECDGTGTQAYGETVTVYIQREYFTCECGYGTDYRCTYRVKRNGADQGVWFSSQFKAERWVGIEFPEAVYDEPEDDGEAWLRRCEGW